MFDIGGWELAVIVAVAVFVIGPDELPATLRTLGRMMRHVRSLSAGFRAHVDDMIREAELDDLRKAADTARQADFGRIVEDTLDPDHVMRDAAQSMGEDPVASDVPPTRAPQSQDPEPADAPANTAAPKQEGQP